MNKANKIYIDKANKISVIHYEYGSYKGKDLNKLYRELVNRNADNRTIVLSVNGKKIWFSKAEWDLYTEFFGM